MAHDELTQNLKDREAQVQRAGREARRAGLSMQDNPHSKRMLQHFHWATGWVAEDMLTEEGVDLSADVVLIPEVQPLPSLCWKGVPVDTMTRGELIEALHRATRMMQDSFLSRRRFNHARREVAEGLFHRP